MVATTPYFDLSSEDILSAHISALQANINKLESVLDLVTTQVTGHVMNPVADQTDQTLRYKIYEGVDRNWLTSPSPIIYRNGTVVNSSEYTLHAAQGAIVFLNQQKSTDAITYDATIITGNSNLLNNLSQGVATNTTNIQTNTSNISKNTLVTNNVPGTLWQAPQTYMTHTVSSWLSTVGAATLATAVSSGVNNMDAFPFVVTEPSTFDKMRINIGTGSASGLGLMAVYSNVNNYPGVLLAKTNEFSTVATGVQEVPFASGDLVLQPGKYWIVRWQSQSISLNDGLAANMAIPIGDSTDATIMDNGGSGAVMACCGVRVTITYNAANLPTTFWTLAQGAKYLKRTAYGSVWIRRKA